MGTDLIYRLVFGKELPIKKESAMNLDELIEEVSEYSKEHTMLAKAHHFTFAKLHPKSLSEEIEFVVMGMNPGETKQDWKEHPGNLHEETCRHDFRGVKKLGTNSENWHDNVSYFCGTSDVFLTEAFFWSSANTGKAFEEKFGATVKCPCIRPHFNFCRDQNLQLIEELNPRVVIAPGLTWRKFIASIYGLKEVKTIYCDNKPTHRLIVEYIDASRRPWIFTKHWSGARGFTNSQKDKIAKYIQAIP